MIRTMWKPVNLLFFQCLHFYVLLLFFVFLDRFLVVAKTDPFDDWVDPFDMLNYDRYSKTMKNNDGSSLEQRESHQALKVCKDSLRVCEQTITKMKMNTSEKSEAVQGTCFENSAVLVEHCKRVSGDSEAKSRLYMQRFVNILIKTAGMNHASVDEFTSRQFEIHMSATAEQIAILRKFGRNEGDISLATLDEIFSDVMKSKSSWVLKNVLSFLDYFYSNFSLAQVSYTALMLLVPLTVALMILVGWSTVTIAKRSLIMVFVVGFVITYKRMLKLILPSQAIENGLNTWLTKETSYISFCNIILFVAEIRSYVHEKYSAVPEQCQLSPSEMTWSQWLFFDSKRNLEVCQKYYEVAVMDPNLHVSPEMVLSEMMSLFVLHPIDLISDKIVKFTTTILGGLPFMTNWIVLVLSMVTFIALVVLTCGLLSGGHISFLGLHVGFKRRESIIQKIDNNALPPSTDQQNGNGQQPSLATSPVFNIHINLQRRLSFGRSDGSEISPVLKVTSPDTSSSSALCGVDSGQRLDRGCENKDLVTFVTN